MSTEPQAPQAMRVRPAALALVFAGGALGTLARALIALAVPDAGHLPVGVLVGNVSGSLLLGLLLALTIARRPDEPARTNLTLFFGTGLLGGFTTYSSLAGATSVLLIGGHWVAGAGYALGSVVLGVLAAWVGARVGGAIRGNARSAGATERPRGVRA